MRLSIVPLVVVVLARAALADTGATETPSAADEELYHCDHKTGLVALTFKPEIELKDLVTWAMGFTCKNFMYDPSYVQRGKKLTLIAPTRLTPAEAYQVFLVALSTIGLTAVPKGNVIRIVESQVARGETVPIVKNVPEGSEQIVRYVLRPTYAQATTVQQALATMKSTAGDVQVVGTVLLITDFASNVRDMMQVVKLIDVPGGTDGLYTIPVHHADAEKLVKELEGVLAMTAPAATDKGAAPPAPSKLLVDSRTNTLIVAASEAAYQRVKAIVDRIDIAVETESGGSMHVYQLKSAIAEEVAKTLNDAISGQTKSATGPAKPGAAETAPLALEGTARVIADKATNKLIVTSTGRDFLAIKSMIQELDEPRRQIYIEAMIMEVQLGNNLNFGFSAHGGIPTENGSSLLIGGVQTPDLRSTNVSTLAAASGLIGGLVAGPLANSQTILGTSIPTYGLLFQALSERSNTNILSAPSIIALDNEDAKYQVGTNIPYKKGVVPISQANPTSAVTTNIERQDLLLELDIKPHISSNDTVMLEVKHQSKELGDNIADLGPSWSTRDIETRVVVKDQQTVVIGGLMQEREYLTRSQVPVLGDIPVLGHLFKYTRREKKKTNLLILLTPYIVRDQMDLELIRQRRVREQDEFIRSVRSLDGMKLNPHVDYRKKRGLVEEINRSIGDVEAEAAARAELATPPVVVPGPVAPRADDR